MLDLSECNHQMLEISFIDDKKCNYHQLFNYLCEQIVNELKNSNWQEAYDFMWRNDDKMEQIDSCHTFSRMLKNLNVVDENKRSAINLLLHKTKCKSFTAFATVYILKKKNWNEEYQSMIQFKLNVKNHQILLQMSPGAGKEKSNQLRRRIRSKGRKSFVVRAVSNDNGDDFILAVKFTTQEDAKNFKKFVGSSGIDFVTMTTTLVCHLNLLFCCIVFTMCFFVFGFNCCCFFVNIDSMLI